MLPLNVDPVGRTRLREAKERVGDGRQCGGAHRPSPGCVRLTHDLLDERRFGNGMVHLHYRTTA